MYPQPSLGFWCMAALAALGAFRDCATAYASSDLEEIATSPVAPQYPVGRFFQIHDLSDLAFSPDNRTLYFVRNDGRVDNVFAIDLAGRTTRRVTAYREPVHELLVGRKGRYLFVTRDVGGNESYSIYRFDLASGETRQLTRTGAGDISYLCDLSPDGTVLYYGESRNGRSQSDLFRLELETGERRILLPADGRLLECGEVSEDGRFLLFREFVNNHEKHLGLLDLSTGKARYILRAQGVNNVDAGFSADSVYFLNAMGSDGFRLWKYRIGDPLPKLAKRPMPNALESLSLQAGGRIAVIRYRSGLASRTAILAGDFAEQRTFGLPQEAIAGAVFSRTDPTIGIIVTADAAMPRRYWLLGSEGPQLLYGANQSGIDTDHFAQSRSLRVPSFDGLLVPVHLFVPNGTSEQSPRPAIFLIHGGPQEHIDPEFNSRIQFLANRGFIVVTPNVRGSSGFGKGYAMLDDGDWGGGHVRDIVEVAGFVRALDFVDKDNLFILGESFGGFSVLSLITQYPHIFRAAVSISGMAELADFVDSWPPYAHSYVLLELGFDPKRNPQRNRAVSPLYRLHRIRIPLQIHQGRNDRRVPKEQIDRLVARMRGLGLSVEYHVYQDEGHGFLRARNEQAAFSRIVDFFRRHVR